MMNILNVNMSQHPAQGGGAAERTLKLTLALNETEGAHARILTTDYGIKNQFVHFTLGNSIVLPCWNTRWYIPAPQLKRIYQAVAWADIVHLINHWSVLNSIIYIVVRMQKKPYVICPAGTLPVFGRSSTFKRLYSLLIGNSMLSNASSVIAITEDEVGHFSKMGIARKRIVLIQNGVWEKDFGYTDEQLFRDSIGLQEQPYVLFIGRLNYIKGPDILLQSFIQIADKYPLHHLVFIGPDGGMEESLKLQISNQKLSRRIHVSGFAGGDLKSSAYHGAQLVVVPSRQEAMSIVALEAALCGTPVLLTDQCGFSDIEKIGGGEITSTDDVDMAKSIDKLLADPEKLKHMGDVAQQYVTDNFDWRLCAKKILRQYDLILSAQMAQGDGAVN